MIKADVTLQSNGWAKSQGHPEPWSFIWDQETGTFGGKDGDKVKNACDLCVAIGYVTQPTFPEVPITDPYHDFRQLCYVLSTWCNLILKPPFDYPTWKEYTFQGYTDEERADYAAKGIVIIEDGILN